MVADASRALVRKEDVADILDNLALLMAAFHKNDIALQDALSALTHRSDAGPNMSELQHIDLLTQSHFDLSKLLAVLAPCLRGASVFRDDVKGSLTLRSLQDALIEPQALSGDSEAGDVSLF